MVRLGKATAWFRSALLLAGILLAAGGAPLDSHAANYTKAEADEAVKKVQSACADAQKAANDLEAAVREIVAQIGKMEGFEKNAEKIARELNVFYGGILGLDDKIRVREVTDKEIEKYKADKDAISKRHADAIAAFDEAWKGYKTARDVILGADGNPGAQARYETARKAAQMGCWIKGAKCPDAAAIYEDIIMNGLMVAFSDKIKTFETERDKVEGWFERSAKDRESFLKTERLVDAILNTQPPLPQPSSAPGTSQPPRTYTVQFLTSDGTEIPGFSYTIKSNENKALAKPDRVPERKWYKFLYWSTDRRGDSGEYVGWGVDQFGKGDLAEETSLSLFAIWEEIPVHASFYSGLSKDGEPEDLVREDKLYRSKKEKLPAPSPENLGQTRWGHDFAGWVEALPGRGLSTSPYVFGAELTNDVVLCPVWKERPMAVARHDFADGRAVPFGKVIELRLSDRIPDDLPSADGYEYVGWGVSTGAVATLSSLVPVGEGALLGDYLKAPAESLDLYAMRRPVLRKAVFRGVGGAIVATAWGSIEEAVTPPAAPESPGRLFRGWFAGQAEKPYEPGPLKADIELFARYEAVEYAATFVLGPGTNVVVAYSVDAPLVPPPVPERDGWTFKSWSREPDRVIPPVFASVVATNATFYAIGEPEMIPYEFRSWGSIIVKGKVAYGEKLVPPNLVEALTGKPIAPCGWGWRSNASPEEFFNFEEPVRRPPRGMLRLCAVWPEERWGDPPRVEVAQERKALSGDAK